MRLIISEDKLRLMEGEAEKHYPYECCGFIFGKVVDDIFLGEDIFPVKNLSLDKYEFIMDENDIIKADNEARKRKLEIVGIYHSHPDHPPIASKKDLNYAFPKTFYIIFSVEGGRVRDFKGWILNGNNFVEGEVEIFL